MKFRVGRSLLVMALGGGWLDWDGGWEKGLGVALGLKVQVH